jgi:acyl dehydratase
VTATGQRYWDDVREGEPIPSIAFPLSLYRLVVEAGANRDFNSIHHNSEYAKRTGADEAYANTLFLQGMWERAVREFIGDAGTIRSLRGFRMRSFNLVGDMPVVEGRVSRIWLEPDHPSIGFAELILQTRNRDTISVGPGTVVATLPRSIASHQTA